MNDTALTCCIAPLKDDYNFCAICSHPLLQVYQSGLQFAQLLLIFLVAELRQFLGLFFVVLDMIAHCVLHIPERTNAGSVCTLGSTGRNWHFWQLSRMLIRSQYPRCQ